MLHSKGRPHEEKLLFFRILPHHLPPSPSPQFGKLVKLFSDVNIKDLKASLELKKILHILYNILYIYNLRKQLKVQIIGMLRKKALFIDQRSTYEKVP